MAMHTHYASSHINKEHDVLNLILYRPLLNYCFEERRDHLITKSAVSFRGCFQVPEVHEYVLRNHEEDESSVWHVAPGIQPHDRGSFARVLSVAFAIGIRKGKPGFYIVT